MKNELDLKVDGQEIKSFIVERKSALPELNRNPFLDLVATEVSIRHEVLYPGKPISYSAIQGINTARSW